MNLPRTHTWSTRAHAARLSLAALGLAAALPQAAQAQTYSLRTLASFNNTNGAGPKGDLTLFGGALYGTTGSGGAYANQGNTTGGTVFSIPAGGGPLTTLASFNYYDGNQPEAGLTLSADGRSFYGTTQSGGYGTGGVFSIPVGGGTPSVVAFFGVPSPNSHAAAPQAPLTLSADGKTLYGTGSTAFSLQTGGGTPTDLTSVNGAAGPYFFDPLTLSADGKTLYGPGTSEANPLGAVFSIPTGGGAPTVLASFNRSNGATPRGKLTLSADGKTLYGTTADGGANNDGVIFSVPVSGGTPTTLFSFNGTNGQSPFDGLTLSGDTLYGTTAYGGIDWNGSSQSGHGTVFALSLAAPEPSAWASLGVGCLGVAALVWRGRKRMQA